MWRAFREIRLVLGHVNKTFYFCEEEGQMRKNNIKPIVAAIGSTIALAVAAPVSAGDNPFQLMEFGNGIVVAGDAVDMQGNKVMINDETGFTYGGDQMGKYAGGKVATGKKDPAVCGTFSGSMCSMPHLSK